MLLLGKLRAPAASPMAISLDLNCPLNSFLSCTINFTFFMPSLFVSSSHVRFIYSLFSSVRSRQNVFLPKSKLHLSKVSIILYLESATISALTSLEKSVVHLMKVESSFVTRHNEMQLGINETFTAGSASSNSRLTK